MVVNFHGDQIFMDIVRFLVHEVLRRVHTNPLKCALDQTASSRFEPIHIRSIHTLFTESKFDYRLPKIYCEAHNDMKVYLKIYAIYNAIMETLASFFRVYEVINHEVLTKLRIQTRTSIALIIYGTTRTWRVENLITHGITDKAPYLSEVIALRLLFLSLLLVFLTIDHARIYNTNINSGDDAIHLQTGFKPPMEVD